MCSRKSTPESQKASQRCLFVLQLVPSLGWYKFCFWSMSGVKILLAYWKDEVKWKIRGKMSKHHTNSRRNIRLLRPKNPNMDFAKKAKIHAWNSNNLRTANNWNYCSCPRAWQNDSHVYYIARCSWGKYEHSDCFFLGRDLVILNGVLFSCVLT